MCQPHRVQIGLTARARRAMDAKLGALRAGADLTRVWLVVDMDAFYASVEELDDPSLVRPRWACAWHIFLGALPCRAAPVVL